MYDAVVTKTQSADELYGNTCTPVETKYISLRRFRRLGYSAITGRQNRRPGEYVITGTSGKNMY